ncbi:MAG: glycosyltransferase family 2 protein, partial [Chloroflexi bacterium]|nr:glycosyltransferase family 2 protein [Chloroflexota bacterium]
HFNLTAIPLVYVITLNYNHREQTLAFVESYRQLAYANYRLLVVDNGSTDGSAKALAARFPDVEQLANGRNLGFAAGMNAGLRHALDQGADFVFLANNDTYAGPELLDHLVEAARCLEAGLLAPHIFYAGEPQRTWSLGGWRNRLTLEIRPCRQAPPDRPLDVDFVTACGLLMARPCLEEVGLFDERFFMYYEDLDYCLRARRAGYRIVVVPEVKMWHWVAVTIGGRDSPAERYHMALSSVRFFRKHASGSRWLVVAPYRAASALKTTLRLLAGGRRPAAGAYWQGLRDGLLEREREEKQANAGSSKR